MTDEDPMRNRDVVPAALSALREVVTFMDGILVTIDPNEDDKYVSRYWHREYTRMREDADRLRDHLEDLADLEYVARAAARMEERDSNGGDA
jgi:hypothetical protein